MTDQTERVNYGSMFDVDRVEEPVEEVIEDPIEDPIKDPIEEPIEEPVEEIKDSVDTFVTANIDDVGKLRVRKTASAESDILSLVSNKEVLRVLNEDNQDWAFVEVLIDNVPVRGYVKKALVVEAPAPVV